MKHHYNFTIDGKVYRYEDSVKEILDRDVISINSLASSLSNICRFNGHADNFYSVAQHSVLVAANAATKEEAKYGLLHDAAEAFIGDITSNLKKYFNKGSSGFVKDTEDRFEEAVFRRYKLEFPIPFDIHSKVKLLDKRAFATEARDLLSKESKTALDSYCTDTSYPAFAEKIVPLPPDRAKLLFVKQFDRLFG